MNRALRVRDATVADLERTALLHVTELPVGLFPRLGPRFVRRWHQGVVRSQHGVVLVCERIDRDGTTVVGFLLGATHRTALVRDLLTRDRTALVGCAALALAGRPRTLLLFARTRLRRYTRRLRTPAAVGGPEGRVADLSAIAVDLSARDQGAGAALVRGFLARCAVTGVRTAELVTEIGGPAESFYRGLGWSPLEDVRTRDGRWVRRFGTTLPVEART